MSGRRRATGWGLLAVILCLFAWLSAAAASDRPSTEGRVDALMVAFRATSAPAVRSKLLSALGLEPDAAFRSPHFARVRLSQGRASTELLSQALQQLRQNPLVRVAEPDYRVHAAFVPNDPRFPDQWALQNTGQGGGTPGADVDAVDAWDVTTGSSATVVAVIDTGIDYTHPDLRDNVLRDSGGNLIGYDFVHNTTDPMDDNGHGTHVSGIIGARGNNGIGVSGVCPNVRLMPLKFLASDGTGSTSDAIRAFDFASSHGARVLNNSWTGGEFSQLLLEAVQRAEALGVLVVAAAGNEGLDDDVLPAYPAGFTNLAGNVISVAASGRDDSLAGFSNYGRATVDIAAPGVAILSTMPHNSYAYLTGTSMATPQVSGAAALVLSRYPQLIAAQVRARLLYNADAPLTLGDQIPRRRLNASRSLVVDNTPPDAPRRLTVAMRSSGAVLLTWTAPSDDGLGGRAGAYELQFSTSPLDAGSTSGELATDLPSPGAAGSAERYLLTGLLPDTAYTFALRAIDRVGNTSTPVSVSVTTSPPANQYCALLDDVEGPHRFLGEGGWGATTEDSVSPRHSYTDGADHNYASRQDRSLVQNVPISLSGFAPELAFFARTDLEPGFDFLYVEVSLDDGVSWRRLSEGLTGTSAWTPYRVSLGEFYGATARVRFHLLTGGGRTRAAVWLDDIQVCGEPLQSLFGAPPAAPSALQVTPEAQGTAHLTWQSGGTDETGFQIERRSGAGPFATVTTVGAGVTSADDVTLAPSTSYTYRVRAFNPAGLSSPTDEVTILSLPPPPPSPAGLRAAGLDGAVELTWVSSNGADSYTVGRSLATGGPYVLLASGVASPSYTDRQVADGTRYYYVVRAVNAGGGSPWSGEVWAVPGAVAPPAPPTHVTAHSRKNAIRVTWRQSATGAVTKNRIYRARGRGGAFVPLTTLPASTRFLDTSVLAGVRYRYKVTSIAPDGQESLWSSAAGAVGYR